MNHLAIYTTSLISRGLATRAFHTEITLITILGFFVKNEVPIFRPRLAPWRQPRCSCDHE